MHFYKGNSIFCRSKIQKFPLRAKIPRNRLHPKPVTPLFWLSKPVTPFLKPVTLFFVPVRPHAIDILVRVPAESRMRWVPKFTSDSQDQNLRQKFDLENSESSTPHDVHCIIICTKTVFLTV